MTDHNTGLIRPHYFDRQQLTAADLNAEQQYFRERLRRHNRFLHGWGVVSGAAATLSGTAGKIDIGEGYVVTPHGDEIYIPAGTQVDVGPDLNTCLGAAADPCTAVRIVDAVIDPEGKDQRSDYNVEWIELLIQERMSLDGYIIQHTINPGTPREAFEDYYTFRENKSLPFGTTIRIHSGAAQNDPNPEPDRLHRYVADEHQVGNWRLNNTRDTIRILNPDGVVVHTRTFTSTAGQAGGGVTTAYLIVCPCEQPMCPKPLMPERCQPPGGEYEWSRAREIFRLQLLCELPPSHQTPLPNCEALDAFVCGRTNGSGAANAPFGAHIPPPPPLDPQDNGVVLATLSIQNGAITNVDNFTHRRQLLSDELLLAYLRCQCVTVEPPKAAFTAQPVTGAVPLTVSFTDQSTGQITNWAWNFGDGGNSNQRNPTRVYQAVGTYTASLTVTGPGGTDTTTRAITVRPARSILRIAPPVIEGNRFTPTQHQVSIFGQGLGDATAVVFANSANAIANVAIIGRNDARLDLLIALRENPVTGSRPFTISFPDGTQLSSGAVQLDIRVGFFFNVAGENIVVNLPEAEFNLDRGHEEVIEVVSGIGTVRGTRLREEGADNVLALAVLPPERTAEILDVNIEIATRLRDNALDRLRR
jgi:PKD repeat protein